MDDMNAFERQVAGEVIRQMGQGRPVDAVAVFTTAVPDTSRTRRFQTMFSAAKLVAACAIVALVGGFLLAGVQTIGPDNAQAPAAVSTAQAESPAASTTPDRSSEAVRLAGDGPVVVWEQIAGPPIEDPGGLLSGRSALVFDEDRFLLIEGDSSRLFESTDGREWAEQPTSELVKAWSEGSEHDDRFVHRFGDGYVSASGGTRRTLGFYMNDGTRLACDAAEGAEPPCRSPVPPGTLVSVAVSPSGIVVIVRISSKMAVEEIFGSEVARSDWRWVPDWDKVTDFGDEIWALETEDGEIHEVVWGNHGFLPDSEDWVYVGWHSADGVDWTRIPHLYGELVLGTAEGFWTPDQSGMWFSPDGLDWERVGLAWDDVHPPVTPWSTQGGLLVLEPPAPERGRSARFLLQTPEGVAELSMSKPLARVKPTAGWDEPVTGPLGMVAADSDADEILFSADGSSWGVSPFPAAWQVLEPADDSDFPPGAWAQTSFTVGDGEVLAVRSKCPAAEPTAELCGALQAFAGTLPWETTVWRGTVVEPTTEKG